MAQTIKLRRSSTASAVPTTGQLDLGEVAINTYDGKAYFKKDNGTPSIVELSIDGHLHASSDISDFNTSVDARVTFEALNANSDIGVGASQVAAGDHNHAGTYLPITGGTLTGTLVLDADPTQNLHAATKQYVDNIAQGLDSKDSVRCATTANVTLSGEQTLDGVLTSTDRVLVKNQTAPAENGIYVSAAGAWTRAVGADTWVELVSAYVFIEEGTVHADQGWVCTVNGGGTLETTAITWTQFAGSGGVSALDDLTDVNVGTPGAGQDGHVLQWNNGAGEYDLVAQSGGASSLNELSDVTITTPATDEVLTYTGAGWENQALTNGAKSTTISAWTLESGDLYYADYTHNLGTTDIAVFLYDSVTLKAVDVEDLRITNTNTIRLWVRGNSESIKVNLVTGKGQKGDTGSQGPAGGGATNMNSLTDADTTTSAPSTDDVLAWNGSNWVPAATLRKVGINTQVGSYTLALTDEYDLVRMNVGTANNLTVPPNSTVAFEIGTQVMLTQTGAGQTTVVAGGGVTVNSNETLKLRTQHSTATLIKVATDEWLVVGDMEASP